MYYYSCWQILASCPVLGVDPGSCIPVNKFWPSCAVLGVDPGRKHRERWPERVVIHSYCVFLHSFLPAFV